MRMRKKKHLDERLDAVGEILFSSKVDDLNFATSVNSKDYIDVEKWFGRKAPLYLEVGCGKGGFAVEFAKRNPEINLLAVEKSANVIVEACEKAINAGVNNLRFIKCGAEYLPKYLKDGSVDRIILNFSCPFPKSSYASHRLTHPNFLKIYSIISSPNAEIHQKTDNMKFFEYSIESLSNSGFLLKNISLDLHNSKFNEDNIETEYEHKFASQGMPIYRLEAKAR